MERRGMLRLRLPNIVGCIVQVSVMLYVVVDVVDDVVDVV